MVGTEESLADHTDGPQNDDKIDLLDVLLFLVTHKRRVLWGTLLGVLVGIALALFLRPEYSATTVILPPQMHGSSSAALMGELGALSGLGQISGIGTALKNPATMYVGLLESRTIADGIIRKFDMKRVYRTNDMTDTRKALKKHSTISASKDGLISVTVTDHDPTRASSLANAYVKGLYEMNSHLAITDAAQRRVFFGQQLDSERVALADAEEAFRNVQEKTGIIQLSGQAESIIRTIASLNAQITAHDVQLQAMKTFATDQNPDVLREQQRIDELRKKLAKLEMVQSKAQGDNFDIPAGKVPEAGLEYARSLRDLRFHETLYELLAKQYETARIDEAESAPLIQVVDKAIPPEKKSGPHRFLILIGCVFGGFLCGVLWALAVVAGHRLRNSPDRAEKIRQIRLVFRN